MKTNIWKYQTLLLIVLKELRKTFRENSNSAHMNQFLKRETLQWPTETVKTMKMKHVEDATLYYTACSQW